MTNIDDIITAFLNTQKEMIEIGKATLKTAFDEFFTTNPKITSISWTQYTQNFNDGEPCTFSVYMDYPQYTLLDDDEEEYSHDDYYSDKYPSPHPEISQAIREFIQKVQKLPNDVFENIFGDGVKVTATKDGFTVDEYYDHE